jgi:HlyD family secretion protein
VGSKVPLKRKTAVVMVVCLAGVAGALAALAPRIQAQQAVATTSESSDEQRWQAVAPGRVESWSGEIRMSARVVGLIGEVLVKTNDKVFAGEPLIRLHDNELQARLATAQAQVAMRKRVRDDQNPTSRAADRREAEDAVADAERAVVEARSALDKAAAEVRARGASDAELDTPRSRLSRATELLQQQKAALARIKAQRNTPLPTEVEGQLNIARAELLVVEAAIEKMTIRAPIAGSVLQVNAKVGELATPSATQPLILLGETSVLRVRAELDERDFREIRIGQPVVVRAAAFRGREITGKVSFIAPIVRPGGRASDLEVVEILVDLAERGPLAVRMKVDVYFRSDSPRGQ